MAHHVQSGLLSARHLQGVTNAAAQIIEIAQQAYACGLIGDGISENLRTVQWDLIRLLATYKDGVGYGHIPNDMLDHMLILEQVATDLLAAYAHMKEAESCPSA